MVRFFLGRAIARNKELIYREASYLSGFMQLLMKPRNSDERWTREEKAQLRENLRHLAVYVPVLIIFLLPGGTLLLPLLAEALDRRKKRRG